jgi:hypothetical protein
MERIRLLLQAIEGVAWMHSHGTPHCDLKSDNMLVIERLGRPIVKVTDFGGTRALQKLDPRASTYTQSRAAPEVVTGDPAAITPSADVYSLCKECAELLGSENGSTSIQYLGLEDAALDEIVEHGTLPEPRNRFANADALRSALCEYRPPWRERATRAVEAWLWPARGPIAGRSARARRGNRWPFAIAAVAVVCIVGSFVLAMLPALSSVRPRPYLPVTAPDSLAGVAVVREKTSDGIATLAKRLGLEGVRADAPATKRLVWARIIRHLAQQAPSAIALDIAFRHHPDPQLNAVMTEAIAAATSGPAGVPVIVASEDFAPGSPELRGENPLIRGLEAAGASWGCLNCTKFRLIGHGLTIPFRENAEPRLPLSVATVVAARGDGSAKQLSVQLDPQQCLLRFVGRGEGFSLGLVDVAHAREVPHSHEIAGLQPYDVLGIYAVGVPSDEAFAKADLDVLDLVDPDGTWKPLDVKGRAVVLAAYRADDLLDLDGREVPGAWFHAAAIQSMLSGIDSPRVTWWIVLPYAAVFAAGLLLFLPLAMALFRMRGIPVARFNGQWCGTALAPRTAVLRWKRTTLSLAGLALVVPCAVYAGGVVFDSWSVSYVVLLCALGGYVGAVVGVGIACGMAWMGCVRRAWCLDRTTSYTPLHVRTPVPSAS